MKYEMKEHWKQTDHSNNITWILGKIHVHRNQVYSMMENYVLKQMTTADFLNKIVHLLIIFITK